VVGAVFEVDERAVSRETLKSALNSVGYIADDALITTLYLTLKARQTPAP